MRCGPHCGERTKTTVMWEPGPGVQWGEGVAAPCPTPNRGPQSIQNSKSSKLSIRKSQTEPPTTVWVGRGREPSAGVQLMVSFLTSENTRSSETLTGDGKPLRVSFVHSD